MNRTSLVVALIAAGIALAGDARAATSSATTTATTTATITLPDNVVADRASVSADLAAVASAKAKLLADSTAGNGSALQADSAAYEAARLKLDADMHTLHTDAQAILAQDEANLGEDRIALEIYGLINDTESYAKAQAQFSADRAQAEANREAVFGNLCPAGYVCADGPGLGFGFGPGFGNGRGGPRRGR
jgi:hypothetical protein